MAEGDFIDIIEDKMEEGWQWVQTTATAIYHAVQPLWNSAVQTFETVVIQNLWGAAANFVQQVVAMGRNLNLPDLGTAFLMAVEHLGGPLWAAAQTLGSNLLQATLGLLHIQAGGGAAAA